ncbi:hypothetical protein [Luteolibacter soli]|uniref:DUF4153 domain-containing protein n=1 Tax=Luteolibacter soli TaxID=3135280 RepID=A0ABU9AWR1_9BACT
MPYSPFTRFFAVVLVALVAFGLMWPDDRAFQWAIYGTGTIAVLAIVFTWSVVKNAPPLDDRAFHQCLPEGLSRAFLRTMWIHLLVLAGIALAVLVYCWIWNFSWRTASWGVVMLTIPAWALMTAVGVASSAGSSQQGRKLTAWFAIFGTPVLSAVLLYFLNRGVDRPALELVYFSRLKTTALTAATLYPLIWWLVAARKRRTLGLVLGGATSALLPWLAIHGDFMKVSRELILDSRKPSAAIERLTLSRKPFSESDETLIPVGDLIDIQGLAESESARVVMSIRFGEAGQPSLATFHNWEGLGTFEFRNEIHAGEETFRYVPATATNEGGKIVWGAQPGNAGIRKLLPATESFEPWSSVRLPLVPVVLNPDMEKLRERGVLQYPMPTYDPRVTPETFRTKPWTAWVADPGSWTLLGSCQAVEGNSFRLDQGGMIKVLPLREKSTGDDCIIVRYYFEELWQAGPWFGWETAARRSALDIALVAIDETGKHAFLIDDFDMSREMEKVMLGKYSTLFFQSDAVDPAEGAAAWKRVEMLRKSRLYVFATQGAGPNRRVELPGLE